MLRLTNSMLPSSNEVAAQPELRLALSVESGALVARSAEKRYTLAGLISECDFSKPIGGAEREWIDAAGVGLEEV